MVSSHSLAQNSHVLLLSECLLLAALSYSVIATVLIMLQGLGLFSLILITIL